MSSTASRGVTGVELLALHPDAIAAIEEFNAIDVELLEEGADRDHVADLALLGENVADA